MNGGRVPGDVVLHPVAIAGLTVLVVNDHVLKAVAPGWVTGKLSDVAGMVFFPFLLLATVDVLRRRTAPGVRSAVVAGTATAVVFAAVKTWLPAREVYVAVVGVLRHPVDTLVRGVASPVEVVVVPDVTDVVAVLACAAVVLVVLRDGRRRAWRSPDACDGRGAGVADR